MNTLYKTLKSFVNAATPSHHDCIYLDYKVNANISEKFQMLHSKYHNYNYLFTNEYS